eukprot:gene1989-biopygen12450
MDASRSSACAWRCSRKLQHASSMTPCQAGVTRCHASVTRRQLLGLVLSATAMQRRCHAGVTLSRRCHAGVILSWNCHADVTPA